MGLPVARVQVGILDGVAAMQHHPVAHINAYMRYAGCVVGAHEEHQIAGLGVGYWGGNIVEPLCAQPPGIHKTAVREDIADEAGAVKGRVGIGAAPQ